MNVAIPYGAETLHGTLPPGIAVKTLDIAPAPAIDDLEGALRAALAKPIGAKALSASVRANERVVIVVPDSFRESAAELVLPVVLDVLRTCGVTDESIRIAFATGSHRAPTDEEQRAIVGEGVARQFEGRFIVHDAHRGEDLADVGVTTRGTPVCVNKALLDCEHIVTIGAVVFHYFAGFGGGRKMIVPGMAGIATIARNHARTLHPTEDRLDPSVRIGVLDGNPIADDLGEAARMIPVTMSVNTVLNGDGHVAGIFCGAMDGAHRAACDFAAGIFAAPLDAPADLVVAASPRTRNFVQTHKALYNAHLAVRPGGRVVFAAPCPEGLGGEQFAQWLRYGDEKAIMGALRRNPQINGQTALSTRQKAPVTYFLTMLSETEMTLLGGTRGDGLQKSIDSAMAAMDGPCRRCVVMPNAAYTVPVLQNGPTN